MSNHQFFYIIGMLFIILAYVQEKDNKFGSFLCWLCGIAFIFLPMVVELWN
jgi:hypothetical protein